MLTHAKKTHKRKEAVKELGSRLPFYEELGEKMSLRRRPESSPEGGERARGRVPQMPVGGGLPGTGNSKGRGGPGTIGLRNLNFSGGP